MFRDTAEELARLQAELLAEEEPAADPTDEEEPYEEDLYQEDYPTYTEGYRVYNTDTTDEDLEEYSETVRQGKSSRGLLVVALILCLLTLGAICLLAYAYDRGLLK